MITEEEIEFISLIEQLKDCSKKGIEPLTKIKKAKKVEKEIVYDDTNQYIYFNPHRDVTTFPIVAVAQKIEGKVSVVSYLETDCRTESGVKIQPLVEIYPSGRIDVLIETDTMVITIRKGKIE